MELASKVHGPGPLETMRKAGLEGRIEKFQATQALRPYLHSLSGTVENSPTDAAPAPLTVASTIAPTSTAATATSTSEPSSCAKEQSNAEPPAAHPHPPPQPPLSSALALRKHLHRRDRSLSPQQLSERSSTDGVELGAPPTPLTEASLVSGRSATVTPTPTPVSRSAPAADTPVDRSLSATPVPPDCSPSASPLSLRPPPAGAGLSALRAPQAEVRVNGRAARSHRSALVPLLGAKEEANGCVRPLSAAPTTARFSSLTSAKEELSAKEDLKIEVLSFNSSVR